jgi:hypothetical protein
MAAGPGGPADGAADVGLGRARAGGRGACAALVARMVPDCTSCDSGVHVLERFLRGGS